MLGMGGAGQPAPGAEASQQPGPSASPAPPGPQAPPMPLVVTCGDWDMRHLAGEAAAKGVALPPLFSTWCNIKLPYTRWVAGTRGGSGRGRGAGRGRGRGRMEDMMGMLAGLGIPHEGHHHSGIDDARNIARIAARLLQLGAPLAATGALVGGQFVKLPPPPLGP